MNSRLILYCWLVCRTKWRTLLACAGIALLFVTVLVRATQARFTANIKVFTSPVTRANLFNQVMGASPTAAMENMMFITSQEALVKSYPVFEKVKKKFEEADASHKAPKDKADGDFLDEGILDQLGESVEAVLFGQEYVNTRKKWSNSEFRSFQSSVDFKPQLSGGTFTVSYKSRDPEKAIQTVRYITDGLMELNIKLANDYATNVSNFLAKKIAEAKISVEDSGKAVADFIVANDFSDNPNILASRYEQYMSVVKEVDGSKIEYESQKALVKEMEKNVSKLQKQVKDVFVQGTQDRVNAMVSQIGQLSAAQTVGGMPNGVTANLEERLKLLQSSLSKEVSKRQIYSGDVLVSMMNDAVKGLSTQKAMAAALKSKLGKAGKISKEYARKIQKYPALQAELSKLLLTHSINTKLLETLTQNYLNSLVERDVGFSKLSIIENPQVSSGLLGSNKALQFFVGVLISLMGIVIGVSFWSWRKGTIFSKHDLLNKPLSFAGCIPHLGDFTEPGAIKRLSVDNSVLMALQHVQRKLLGARVGGSVETNKILLFTSSEMGVGKSVASLTVGAALAQLGHKVLLIDCDFRADSRNLNEYVQKQYKIGIKPFPVSVEGLERFVGSEGKQSFDFARLNKKVLDAETIGFFGGTFRASLDELKKEYEYILLDAPPVFFPETLEMSSRSDGLFVCCHEAKSSVHELMKTYSVLNQHRHENAELFSILTNCQLSENLEQSGALRYYQRKTDRAA